LSSIDKAGKEKSTDAFRFRNGLRPEGEILLVRVLLLLLLLLLLLMLLFPSPPAPPPPDAENSTLLPTALPPMLPRDPVASKSPEESLRRRRIAGSNDELLWLLVLWEADVAVVAVGVVVALVLAWLSGCCAGVDFAGTGAAFEAIG
jgi:hypothetical protein